LAVNVLGSANDAPIYNQLDIGNAPDYTRCQFAVPSRKKGEDSMNGTPPSGAAKICSSISSFVATFPRLVRFFDWRNISLDYYK